MCSPASEPSLVSGVQPLGDPHQSRDGLILENNIACLGGDNALAYLPVLIYHAPVSPKCEKMRIKKLRISQLRGARKKAAIRTILLSEHVIRTYGVASRA